MVLGMAVVVLLLGSFFYAFIISQRKKLKYQQDMQQLRETQQNQLIEAAVRSEEIERHRIAEILHDEVGAILSSSKLHIQGIKLATLDTRDQGLFAKGKELLDDGIQKVRGISHNLHSNILKEFGLNDAIRHFINQTVDSTMIKTATKLDEAYTTVNADKDISIYRMIQELVNNILKHSQADELTITSVYENNHLMITIFHTGKGIDQQQFEALRYKKDGLGLKNIMNRIILLKGSIDFFSDDRGYYVKINAPINKEMV
ncbi:MAG: ATP-binding protein [Ferruginibacter sp.]|nr:ATP-binding protein [Ferruginibacter sp.]